VAIGEVLYPARRPTMTAVIVIIIATTQGTIHGACEDLMKNGPPSANSDLTDSAQVNPTTTFSDNVMEFVNAAGRSAKMDFTSGFCWGGPVVVMYISFWVILSFAYNRVFFLVVV
jgi:hypothetical protein